MTWILGLVFLLFLTPQAAAYDVEAADGRLIVVPGLGLEDLRPPRKPATTLQVEVEGPRRWVRGVPASYEVRVRGDPEGPVQISPAPRFSVLWLRPGTYTLRVDVRAGELSQAVLVRVQVLTPALTG